MLYLFDTNICSYIPKQRLDATLVSNNAKHFRQVPELRWVDWV